MMFGAIKNLPVVLWPKNRGGDFCPVELMEPTQSRELTDIALFLDGIPESSSSCSRLKNEEELRHMMYSGSLHPRTLGFSLGRYIILSDTWFWYKIIRFWQNRSRLKAKPLASFNKHNNHFSQMTWHDVLHLRLLYAPMNGQHHVNHCTPS